MMKRFILVCLLSLWSETSFAGSIANVTVGFSGDVTRQQEVRTLIASQMQALEKPAKDSGVAAINLQSVAYSLNKREGQFAGMAGQPSYQAAGNLFIDIEPESRTGDFVELLTKKGFSATINYYQRCIPPSSR